MTDPTTDGTRFFAFLSAIFQTALYVGGGTVAGHMLLEKPILGAIFGLGVLLCVGQYLIASDLSKALDAAN